MSSPMKRAKITDVPQADSSSDSSEMIPGFTTVEFVKYLEECNIFRNRVRREYPEMKTFTTRISENSFTRMLRNIFEYWVQMCSSQTPHSEGDLPSYNEFGANLSVAARVIIHHISSELQTQGLLGAQPNEAEVSSSTNQEILEIFFVQQGGQHVGQRLPVIEVSDVIRSFQRPQMEFAQIFEILYRITGLTEAELHNTYGLETKDHNIQVAEPGAAEQGAASTSQERGDYEDLRYFRVFLVLELRALIMEYMTLNTDEGHAGKKKLHGKILYDPLDESSRVLELSKKGKEPDPMKDNKEDSPSEARSTGAEGQSLGIPSVEQQRSRSSDGDNTSRDIESLPADEHSLSGVDAIIEEVSTTEDCETAL